MGWPIYNRLLVEGAEADIDRLRKTIFSDVPDHHGRPSPTFYKGILTDEHDEPDFDGYEEGGNDDSDCLDLFFNTNKVHAREAIKAIAVKFPTLEGTYSAGNPDTDWYFHDSFENGVYKEGDVWEGIEGDDRIHLGIASDDDDFEDDEDDEDEDKDDEFDDEGEDA